MKASGIVISSLIVVLGIFGLLAFITIIAVDSDRKTAIEILGAISGVLGGLAGVIATILAFIGLSTWKRQLTIGKYLEIFWEAKQSLRRFRSEFTHWHLVACKTTPSDRAITSSLEYTEMVLERRKALDNTLKTLQGVFTSIDVLIVDDDWLWLNKISFLRLCIADLEAEISKLLAESTGDAIDHISRVAPHIQKITESAVDIQADLDTLHKKWK